MRSIVTALAVVYLVFSTGCSKDKKSHPAAVKVARVDKKVTNLAKSSGVKVKDSKDARGVPATQSNLPKRKCSEDDIATLFSLSLVLNTHVDAMDSAVDRAVAVKYEGSAMKPHLKTALSEGALALKACDEYKNSVNMTDCEFPSVVRSYAAVEEICQRFSNTTSKVKTVLKQIQ